MSEDDFDLFIGTLNLWKKKLIKKPESLKPVFPEPPFTAKRKSATGETMVKIIGQPWFENGKWIFQAEGGILVPADEILPNPKA